MRRWCRLFYGMLNCIISVIPRAKLQYSCIHYVRSVANCCLIIEHIGSVNCYCYPVLKIWNGRSLNQVNVRKACPREV